MKSHATAVISRTIIVSQTNETTTKKKKKEQSKRSSNKMNKPHCRVSMTMNRELVVLLLLLVCHLCSSGQLADCQQQAAPTAFPGVSKDLSSFCASRPSLPVDLASMIVHVKRNVSFNYKLYLFSNDHVFQTGQVIPRDDFRVHSFPVKVKRFQEFWPHSSMSSRQRSMAFDLRDFFRLVPLNEPQGGRRRKLVPPDDARSDPLPGDSGHEEPFISHDVGHVMVERQKRSRQTNQEQHNSQQGEVGSNLNKFIEFDRDDQVSRLDFRRHPSSSSYLTGPKSHPSPNSNPKSQDQAKQAFEQLVLPVGSFSSFHVNLTYLVRKDFDQAEPQLIKLLVDANKFQVTHWEVLNDGTSNASQSSSSSSSSNQTINRQEGEDFAFLSHKLLRDVNTRITSINQIYEDWITRNFYTIVYVQRRLIIDDGGHDDNDDDMMAEQQEGEKQHGSRTRISHQLINDRLIFRGSSVALLGADQLDYQVKAATFITEKNGLHYYIEFLNTGKFYLCAIDWRKRPFKIIDWQQFPIKATKTQFDNEELLLCPPAVCYSDRPIDEIVSYGRLNLAEPFQRQISGLTSASGAKNSVGQHQTLASGGNNQTGDSPTITSDSLPNLRLGQSGVDLNQLIEAVKISAISDGASSSRAGSERAIKLHLRDWVWKLEGGRLTDNEPPTGGLFRWRYELAKRNDVKAKPDAYGYTLAGHEIDASYRVYNELYLISANHLISINYTLANETVVSSIPVSEEFPGLISTLVDPITGAFYDRYTNRLYFFKGDRYIGFDYATKKPLEDFILKPSYLHSALWGDLESPSADGNNSNGDGPQILSSHSVAEILGRHHQVDAIYHDLATDLVHIFVGMKFYSFLASEFKDGAFRSKSGELPQMQCFNERFLDGCNFDKAYPNPCESNELKGTHQASAKLTQQVPPDEHHNDRTTTIVESLRDFNQEQQTKLRSIASKAGLLNVLVENSLISKGIRTLEPLVDEIRSADISRDPTIREQEKLLIYLLMAIVVVTILVTVVVILLMISSTSRRSKTSRAQRAVLNQLDSVQLPIHGSEKMLESQIVKRSPSNNYLSNQHQSRLRPYHLPSMPTANNHRPFPASSKPGGSVGVVVKKNRVHRDIVDNSVL